MFGMKLKMLVLSKGKRNMSDEKTKKRCCEMTVETFDFGTNYFKCGKPAKYITPKDKMNPRKMFVCGIHKNSVDKMYENIGSSKRCRSRS